jgi:hypothetical protein
MLSSESLLKSWRMTWFQFPLIGTQNSKSKAASFTFKIERNCKRKEMNDPTGEEVWCLVWNFCNGNLNLKIMAREKIIK